MKEISIFIPTDDLARLTEILKKHNVGGMTFYDIIGAGRTKRDALPEMVRSYMTGRTMWQRQYFMQLQQITLNLDM